MRAFGHPEVIVDQVERRGAVGGDASAPEPSAVGQERPASGRIEAKVDVGGGPVPIVLTGPVQTRVFGKIGNTTGTFDTEIVAMSLTGSVGGVSIHIRESPTLPSSGQTTITDLGGGNWQIESFFDVFIELFGLGDHRHEPTGPARWDHG